ncbi:MAG: hypothetical protein ACR5LA_00870 [Wolbachia sp.]
MSIILYPCHTSERIHFNQYVTGNSLNLKNREINIRELISFLQSNSNITELNVKGCKIGYEKAKELAKLTNLTSLDLSWNKIGAEGIKELAKLTNLTFLDLALNVVRNRLYGEGVKESAKFVNLTSLDLSWNKIGAEGIKELAKLTNLTSLDLSWNNIGTEGIKELAKLTNLTSLNLECNNISAENIKELAKLTNLTSLNLRGNNIGAKGEKVLAESGKDVQGLKDFYENLKKAWLKNSHTSKLNEDATKELFFNLASKRKIEEVLLLLDDPDKYPFLVNSKGSEGRALPYFYSHSPEMQRFLFELLFERGMVPERDDRRIAQDDQSIHISSIAKRTNFFAKKLVKSIKVGEEQSKQAAASYVESIELLKQYQNDPIRLRLLSLTDNEKRSVMEETLFSGSSIQNDKEFINAVIDKAEQVLVDKYLEKNEQGEYAGIYSTSRMQYDYARDNAKITIPESIGYIKLLIDNFVVPLKEKKELLVTLMEQNQDLVMSKFSAVKRELGDFDREGLNKTELHALLKDIDDDRKVDELFKEISGLDIEKIWREQKEFVLLKQIYIAATSYGENNSACIQGTWSQIINSINEISTEIFIQYDHYLEEEQKLEGKKDVITKENIKPFLEDLANKLIQYVELHPELKETLEDFVVGIVDIDKPEEITFEQQKILAEINKYFNENIKNVLQNYDRNIPNRNEYDLVIKGLSEVGIMQHFAQPNQELFNLHIEEIAIQIVSSTLM